MNREIKFRGRSYDGIWMFGYLMPVPRPQIHPSCKHIISAVPHTIKTVDRGLYEVDEDTVGQYTGLKDKNGVEIYEGDIIMSKDSVGDAIYHEVFYEEKEGRFMGALNFNKKPSFGVSGLSQGWIDSFEKVIVGNIYDNPELIGGVKR